MVTSAKILLNSIISPKTDIQKALFLKRLGSLLEEGYSLKKSLNFMEKFEMNQSQKWINQIQEALIKGKALHEELESIAYSKKICSQIYLASQYGDYGKTIRQCGEDLLVQEKFKKRIRSLLAYPLLLLFFLFSMLMLMRFLVLPNMENLFPTNLSGKNIYASLLVSFIYYSPQIILVTALFLLLAFILLKKKFSTLTALDQIRILIKWPFVKRYLRNYWTNFLFLEWGQLLKKGISFQELIAMMSEEEASGVLRETGEVLSSEMLQGKSVKNALKVLPFFEEEALLVISHGENLGQLAIEMIFYAK
ncbi:MAG: type II secretion system F family protein, partial [Atopostipes suicloacalis]|nr:type II secretion system F family protein [Atopostipes suicloacalis]